MSFFSPDSIEETIHTRGRLTVLVFLSTVAEVDFVTLRDAVEMTDGNLSQQLRRLEEATYVKIDKVVMNGRIKTLVSLTDTGHAALVGYLKNIRRLIGQVPKAAPNKKDDNA